MTSTTLAGKYPIPTTGGIEYNSLSAFCIRPHSSLYCHTSVHKLCMLWHSLLTVAIHVGSFKLFKLSAFPLSRRHVVARQYPVIYSENSSLTSTAVFPNLHILNIYPKFSKFPYGQHQLHLTDKLQCFYKAHFCI